MGDGILSKFIYFWIFLFGGLVMARLLGMSDTVGNVVVLSISLAFVYIGWNLFRAKGKQKAAERQKNQAMRPANKNRGFGHSNNKKRKH